MIFLNCSNILKLILIRKVSTRRVQWYITCHFTSKNKKVVNFLNIFFAPKNLHPYEPPKSPYLDQHNEKSKRYIS